MRIKLAFVPLALLALPIGSALADDFWRDVISSGATTASTYLTFRKHDDKLIVAARDDAGSFVASNGTIRGPYLAAALQQMRTEQPGLSASDMELASAILTAEDAAQ
ncbi:DUF2388 domain-containing protein [Pseudomonas sp. 2FE]|uniref:DUF2388 domain-containing protein n=1 Tax=Pseudomonas sp. 2FE TaxID=2502190 RepID=UPI0010F7EC69|nr:DUF2388 domain-containing protein [Pseudomonas sp. 2FE]